MRKERGITVELRRGTGAAKGKGGQGWRGRRAESEPKKGAKGVGRDGGGCGEGARRAKQRSPEEVIGKGKRVQLYLGYNVRDCEN